MMQLLNFENLKPNLKEIITSSATSSKVKKSFIFYLKMKFKDPKSLRERGGPCMFSLNMFMVYSHRDYLTTFLRNLN